MSKPVLTIVAGSNGCGKSSLTSLAKFYFQQFPVLDPDAVARSLQDVIGSEISAVEAGKRVLREADELLSARQSFTVETTLSGSTYLRMAAKAKECGYAVVIFFVGRTSLDINLERVRARVAKGGHDVPEEDQRRRYPRTLANIAKLLPLADLMIFFDNSTPSGHTLVGFGHHDALHWIGSLPEWASTLAQQS